VNSLTTLPSPVVSPEVRAFAVERGVECYLPELVAVARRLFPDSPLNLMVADDLEIADNRQIVFEVEETSRDVESQVAAHWQWTEELFRLCPATHVHVFCLLQR
jgi:hypothetical protein